MAAIKLTINVNPAALESWIGEGEYAKATAKPNRIALSTPMMSSFCLASLTSSFSLSLLHDSVIFSDLASLESQGSQMAETTKDSVIVTVVETEG